MIHKTILTAAALVLGLAVSVAAAQDKKAKTQTAIGPVSKMAGDTLTVDTGKGAMQFITNAQTQVKVPGGGAKAQAARAAGEKGLKISEAVHEGDQVSVKYTDVGGRLVASEIDVKQRRPASAQPVK
jgi:predicted outer membrane protein